MNKNIPFCIHLCFTSETIKLVTEAFVLFLRMYMPTTIFRALFSRSDSWSMAVSNSDSGLYGASGTGRPYLPKTADPSPRRRPPASNPR